VRILNGGRSKQEAEQSASEKGLRLKGGDVLLALDPERWRKSMKNELSESHRLRHKLKMERKTFRRNLQAPAPRVTARPREQGETGLLLLATAAALMLRRRRF
jgi:hypothetical protein